MHHAPSEASARAERAATDEKPCGKRACPHLTFINLFWIFVVGSVLGLIIETVFYALNYGGYQDRAGLLFGPFSPIYGVGAVLMTICLNNLCRSNIVVIFLISALVGGAFEYFASWFMEIAFGAVAWDYTGMWLSVNGRTCGLYMAAWGVLGALWIKVLLPLLLKALEAIPAEWLPRITYTCAALMLVDIVMTLAALEFWQERLSGKESSTPVRQFFNAHFNNDFMQGRFQTMVIHPEA